VESGVDTQHSIAVTKIVSPNGVWVIEAGTRHNDYLALLTKGGLIGASGWYRRSFRSMIPPLMTNRG
jgi:hypothetical protein